MKTLFFILTALFMMGVMSAGAQKPIRVVFIVNVSGYAIGSGGMHVAGEFPNDGCLTITSLWDPAAEGSQMIPTQNGTYTLRTLFPKSAAGLSMQFEFVRNNLWVDDTGYDWSDGNAGTTYIKSNCQYAYEWAPGTFNDMITIPSYDAVFIANFDHCGKLIASPLRISDEGEADEAVTLNLYPNPATDMVFIDGLNDDATVQISNLVGQLVWTGKVSASDPKINVSQLGAGSYFLSIEGRSTVRFNVVK